MTNKKVIIWTPAYNAENTLRRTIDSVLGQTYTNFEYIVIDNASTDGTGDIIREYASKDSRVRLWRNERNVFGTRLFADVIGKIRDMECDFIAELDADDEYLPDFLEKSISFADKQELDIVCVGNVNIFVEDGNKESVGYNTAKDIILAGKSFGDKMAEWFIFAYTIWGKLYRTAMIKNMDLTFKHLLTNGSDTLFALVAFKYANRVGIMKDILHRYYISMQGVRTIWHQNRTLTAPAIDEAARELLLSKCGGVSAQNENLIQFFYLDTLNRSTYVLLNSDTNESIKISVLHEMFVSHKTESLALYANSGNWTERRRALFSTAANWLLTREEVPDEQIEQFCAVGEFVCAACENAEGWLFFKKLLARFLLDAGRSDEARTKLDELAELLPGDAEISALRRRVI
jgi:glycosyltransferase involved in cell wall biosynthesis